MNRRAHSGEDGSFARDAGNQTAKAAVLVVVAVIIGVLLLRHTGTTSVSKTNNAANHKAAGIPTTTVNPNPTTSTSSVPPIPPASIKVLVLNGVASTQPLAGNLSKKLQTSPGYNTLAPDDATSKVTASAIYAVTAQYLPSATTLATSLGLPSSVVLSGVPATAPVPTKERTIANILVVIGPDLVSAAGGSGSGSSSSTTSSGSTGSGTTGSGSSTTSTTRGTTG
ncbi:MAG: hypothetical protein ACRDXE_09565 [Acidimicrobiales bacterium]